jgi:hypothetical protein
MTSSETRVKYTLIGATSNEKIVEFVVDMGDLVFLCDEFSKARIKNYPIIIFEFIEGFYTTKDLYVNNTYNYQMEAFNMNISMSLGFNSNNNSPSGFKKHNTLNSNSGNNVNTNSLIPSSSFSLNASYPYSSFITSNKKEIKFSTLNEKFKQYEFFDKQKDVILSDKSEKIKLLNSKLQIAKEAYSKYFTKYEKFENISRMRKQILQISEKIEVYENGIENLKKVISQKNSDIHISSSIFYLNRENYKDKMQNIDKNFKKIEKYKIMYNAFKNKKLIEIAYFFFNKNYASKLYLVPPFYNQTIDKAVRYSYYEKHSKELAVCLGTIASLANYLSKLFNIPLKYPLFINGSRSFVFKDKKE